MSEEYTETIGNYKITVWMLALGFWAYMAVNGDTYYKGSVNAKNRVEAVRAVYDKITTWTVEEILEREG